jgi:hypothetical protein
MATTIICSISVNPLSEILITLFLVTIAVLFLAQSLPLFPGLIARLPETGNATAAIIVSEHRKIVVASGRVKKPICVLDCAKVSDLHWPGANVDGS